jgi:xylose dehydrogenase (NAD/NADP)
MDASLETAFDDVTDERAAFLLRFEDEVLGSFTTSQNAFQSSHFHVVGKTGELRLAPVLFP